MISTIVITFGACFVVFTLSAFAFFTIVYLKEIEREEKIRAENAKILSAPIMIDQAAIDKLMGGVYAVDPKPQKRKTNTDNSNENQVFSMSGKNNKKDFN